MKNIKNDDETLSKMEIEEVDAPDLEYYDSDPGGNIEPLLLLMSVILISAIVFIK